MTTIHFNSDLELIACFHRGDEKAVTYLFDQFYNLLVDYANILVKNSEEAEDIVVDTFVKLMKLHKNLKTLKDIKAFLYVTTRNDCYDYLRHEKVHNRFEKETIYLSTQDAESIASKDIAWTNAELLHEIYNEVQKLPNQCRAIFELRFIEGLTTPQIAKQMGVTESNVRNQHSKALKLLKIAILKKDYLPTLLLHTLFFMVIQIF